MMLPSRKTNMFSNITPRSWALLATIAFAIVGTLYLGQSHASTFVAASEAEAGNIVSPAVTAASSSASGGSAVRFAAATPTPTPPTPTPPTPPGTPTTWPTGWDDPRFANNVSSGTKLNEGPSMVTWQNLTIVDDSGEPAVGASNYNLLNSRTRGREGPRIGGSNILIQDTYIEVAGVGDDHGDGIQAFFSLTGPNSNYKNVTIKRTKVVLSGGSLNAGIFLADRSNVDLTMDTVFVDGGNAPNGALFFANSGNGADRGCNSLILRHVRVKPKVRFEGLDTCNIIEWTDVAYENGTVIPRPN